MQCGTGLTLHRLSHKGCVHSVALGGLSHRALEDKDLIGHCQGITMIKVDLELSGTVFVNQRIDIEFLLISKVVHVFNEIFKFRHSINTVRESCHLSST